MAAAQRVFTQYGFINAEISQIAEAAGKSTGTFYIYFESKTQLLTAMIDEFLADLQGDTGLAVPTHPPEAIHNVLTTIWNAHKRHVATFRALVDASTKHAEFATLSREIRAFATKDFSQMIEARQAQGFCATLDVAFTASALELLVTNCIYEWLTPEFAILTDANREARAVETIANIFLATFEMPLGRLGNSEDGPRLVRAGDLPA